MKLKERNDISIDIPVTLLYGKLGNGQKEWKAFTFQKSIKFKLSKKLMIITRKELIGSFKVEKIGQL